MTSPKDAARMASTGASKRRSTIYGERKTITLRMGISLNERLMAFCNEHHLPANTHVNALIEAALKKADPSISVRKVSERGEQKIILTLRLEPELRERLARHCSSAAVSTNEYVCALIHKDLKQRGK